MLPDLPVFFSLSAFIPAFGRAYLITHSPIGVLVCALIGLPICWLFDRLLKQTLVGLMPQWFRFRIDTHPGKLSRANLLSHFAALAIGAATHSLWDSFTHADRWGTRLLPMLQSQSPQVFGVSAPWFKVFQYGSTFVFLPLLAWLSYRHLNRVEPVYRPFAFSNKLKAAVGLAMVVGLAGIVAWNVRFYDTNYERLGRTIKSSGALLIVGLIALAVFAQARFGDAMGRLPEATEPAVPDEND